MTKQKLTIQDLIAQGYFKNKSDLSRSINVCHADVSRWARKYGGSILEKHAEKVVAAASKPLTLDDLLIRPNCKTGSTAKRRAIEQKEPIRLTNKNLSTWISAQQEIRDDE